MPRAITAVWAEATRDSRGRPTVLAVRAAIVKPSQVGTLSETLEAVRAARAAGLDCIVSHRSGETDDVFDADLAFAFGAFGLKAGSLRRPERRAKRGRLRAIAG